MPVGTVRGHYVVVFSQGAAGPHGDGFFPHGNVAGARYIAFFGEAQQTNFKKPNSDHLPVHFN